MFVLSCMLCMTDFEKKNISSIENTAEIQVYHLKMISSLLKHISSVFPFSWSHHLSCSVPCIFTETLPSSRNAEGSAFQPWRINLLFYQINQLISLTKDELSKIAFGAQILYECFSLSIMSWTTQTVTIQNYLYIWQASLRRDEVNPRVYK